MLAAIVIHAQIPKSEAQSKILTKFKSGVKINTKHRHAHLLCHTRQKYAYAMHIPSIYVSLALRTLLCLSAPCTRDTQ